jgi:hypothetical protein
MRLGVSIHACTNGERDLQLDATAWDNRVGLTAVSELRPTDLVVLSDAAPLEQRNEVLHSRASGAGLSVLTCAQSFVRFTRALIIHHGGSTSIAYLNRAVSLCSRLTVEPFILTVGRSERFAQLQQQIAKQELAGCGQAASFDYLVSWDIPGAVAGVARWRGCQFVIIEDTYASPRPRWLWRSRERRLVGPSDGLAVLSLHGLRHPCQNYSHGLSS